MRTSIFLPLIQLGCQPDAIECTIGSCIKRDERRPVPFGSGSHESFRCGLHMPLNKFLISLINQIGIGFGQMASNCFTTINAFLAQYIWRDIDLALKFFSYTFRLGHDSLVGFYTLSRRPGRVEWVKNTLITKGEFLAGALSTILKINM